MNNTLLRFLFAIALIKLADPAAAQLVVTGSTDANLLAQKLVGPGVTVSNAVLTTAGDAAGYFTNSNTSIDIDSGVLLTSGSVFNAPGPNVEFGVTGITGTPGDEDLEDLIPGYTTFDAVILEFDVNALGDSLEFKYVFASDEYNFYVNSSFNDVFAFFISGPGIVGNPNIAIVPGTSIPASINNVNCGSYGEYYECNDCFTPTGGGCTTECPFDCSGTTIEYNGFTTTLIAKAAILPCETYHLKLAIADAGDQVLDSGVFIEAGSLTTTASTILAVSAYTDPATGLPAVVEGCNDGTFEIQTCTAVADSIEVPFIIGGTATNGVDYDYIADTTYILPGSNTATVTLNPISDALAEGSESIIIYLYLPGTNIIIDSAEVLILDSLIAVATGDTTICVGQSTPLYANGAQGWTWSPASGLDCNTCQNPIATPLATTTYTLSITVAGCTATDVVTVVVDNPNPVNAGPDAAICSGQSWQINATNASTYSWSPATGLSCTDCSNPLATPATTTTYTVTGVNGCFTTMDEITVTINPNPTVTISPNVSVCPNDTVPLLATGGVSYSWSPQEGLSDATISNPLAVVDQTTQYTVLVTNQFGCVDSASTVISIFDIPEVTVSDDTTIYLGNSVSLYATGGVIYSWNPDSYLDNPGSSTPVSVLPNETITYTVTVISPEGCVNVDSVTVFVLYDALVVLPTAFSPNGDGTNDYFDPLVRGIFELGHFRVYNRWGEVVYESFNMNDVGWDGRYKGKEQETGVYVYELVGTDVAGSFVKRHGDVTLVR